MAGGLLGNGGGVRPSPSQEPLQPGRRPRAERHIAVQVMGLILAIVITAASVQDRDGARPLLWKLAAGYRTISLIWANGGYAGALVTWAKDTLRRTVQVVRRLVQGLRPLPLIVTFW